MLPKYTFALGGTDAIKQIIEFLEGQEKTKQTILDKVKEKQNKNYAIGSDTTFDLERNTFIEEKR